MFSLQKYRLLPVLTNLSHGNFINNNEKEQVGMPDHILDDVQALIDKEFGDKKILEQILRAAKNDEVISNFERNYVRKLAEKHLGKKPLEEKKPSEETKPITPVISGPIQQQKSIPSNSWSEPPKISKSKPKNTKVFLGIGLASLLVIIIAAATIGGNPDFTPTIKTDPTPPEQGSFSITTDLSSYTTGDIISITGNSKISTGNQVNLSIKNSDNKLIWSEQVNVKKDGQFTTLTFSGGPGWEKSGTFTIIAESGSEKASKTFSFRK